MFNNAIDHSSGKYVSATIWKSAIGFRVMIMDDGEGIFTKIQRELNLLDERHAVLELSKGKLTTAPNRHSGEGIFFSSRLASKFEILSGKTYFSHEYTKESDWIVERRKFSAGTGIFIELRNDAKQSMKAIFDKYSPEDSDYGFTKTVVPVKLAQYGDELLVSRSQAKRLLARIEKFQTVLFDFHEVSNIGQAFADEIFRVFHSQNKNIECVAIRANKNVQKMIDRALSA